MKSFFKGGDSDRMYGGSNTKSASMGAFILCIKKILLVYQSNRSAFTGDILVIT